MSIISSRNVGNNGSYNNDGRYGNRGTLNNNRRRGDNDGDDDDDDQGDNGRRGNRNNGSWKNGSFDRNTHQLTGAMRFCEVHGIQPPLSACLAR